MTSEGLLAKWNGLSGEAGGYTRVDPIHPLELYIGYEATGQKALLLISKTEPAQFPSSKSILTSVGQRSDGRWALTFRLIRGEQEEVFTQLCSDLIESSRLQRNDTNGIEFVVSRYRRWHKLMEHQDSGLLSEPVRRGLLGELTFLLRGLGAGVPVLDAVNGWVGSGGADRDFVYSDGWHEVKTVGASAKVVGISSLEQLDAPPPGELVVCFVDVTAPTEKGSFTLNSKVEEVSDAVRVVPGALELLVAKLTDLGYIPLAEYDKQRYRLHGIRRYSVEEDFPRLTRAVVPPQVPAATYEISLSAIEHWRVS